MDMPEDSQHPILAAISAEGFTPLGWFAPSAEDAIASGSDAKTAQLVMLIGNAGPAMFERFARERDPAHDQIDDWCRDVLTPLADGLGARAVFPSDRPYHPFLSWAQRAGAGFPSKLGMNIHPEYGLWHAFRAAFIFRDSVALPAYPNGDHPCETCVDWPCLKACPVSAFNDKRAGSPYDVDVCVSHLSSNEGSSCMTGGCMARLACPVGRQYTYDQQQMQFHLSAFLRTRTTENMRHTRP